MCHCSSITYPECFLFSDVCHLSMALAWLLVLATLPLSVVRAGDSEADTVGQPQVQQSSSQGGQWS